MAGMLIPIVAAVLGAAGGAAVAASEGRGRSAARSTRTHDRPLAAPPFKSYRYRGDYGWIMIGAMNNADALREANRSLSSGGEPQLAKLEVWDGRRYVPANPGERARVARGPRVGQVVVAWIVDTVEVVDPHLTKIDLGHRYKMRAAVEGRSVMWARSGTEADIAKAEKYAREEAGKAAGDPYATGRDHRVFVYPPSERDPLGRARREVVR